MPNGGGLNVAKLALEMENKAIVMSRAELEKLAASGTAAGEKVKAALAAITPIAQTVADRTRQAHVAFTQWQQSQAPINGVTAAIERMRTAIEQVRATAMANQIALNDPFQKAEQSINRVTAALQRMQAASRQAQATAMANQIALNDPFQKAEQSINRVTAALQRMQAASRQAQATAMANQIAARDPFQRGGSIAASPNISVSTDGMEQLGRAAQAVGMQFGAMGQGLAMAGRATGEGVAALRAYIVQAMAAATATGTLTAGQVRLAAASKAAGAALSFFGGPVGLAVIAVILAAKAGWDSFTRSQERAVEAAEKNIEVQTRLADVMRQSSATAVNQAFDVLQAERRLAAFRAGGTAGLQKVDDATKAFNIVRQQMIEAKLILATTSEADIVAHESFERRFASATRLVAIQRTLTTEEERDRKRRDEAEEARKRAHAQRIRDIEAQADAIARARATELDVENQILAADLRARNAARDQQQAVHDTVVAIDQQTAALARLNAVSGASAAAQLSVQRQNEIEAATRGKTPAQIDEITAALRRLHDEQDKGRLAEDAKRAADAMQQAFDNAFQNIAARGKATFGDLFRFIEQALRASLDAQGKIKIDAAAMTSSFYTAVASVAGNIFDGLFGGGDEARQRRLQFEREVDAFNDTLDRWIADLRNQGNTFAQALDGIHQQSASLSSEAERIFQEQMARVRALEAIARQTGIGPLGDSFRERATELATQAQLDYELALQKVADATQAAIDAANKLESEQKATNERSLLARLARAQGNDALAQQIERAQQIADVGNNSYFQSLLEQIFAAEDAAAAMQKLTDNISDLKNVLDNLQEFEDRLKLSNLSPLNPIQQLQEARRQFETMAALALSGDRTAAASLSGSGTSFLEASRGVFASSGGYVSDFQRVQDVIDAVQGRFAGELSLEEQSLAELKGQTKRIDDIARRAEEQRDGQIAVLADGFTRTIARLDAVAEEVAELSTALVRADDQARA